MLFRSGWLYQVLLLLLLWWMLPAERPVQPEPSSASGAAQETTEHRKWLRQRERDDGN